MARIDPTLTAGELAPLTRLSIVIPARDEEGSVASTVESVHGELAAHHIPHEIIVVDDGSTDQTWRILQDLMPRVAPLRPVRNAGRHGFGRAVSLGFAHASGDALVIMMADESDDCHDVVRYWDKLNEGYHCVFGSRFVNGGRAIGHPFPKLVLNRLANTFVRVMFGFRLNDTTNAFKAYRREVIDGCGPLIAPHFNLTVELPLKAIVRGFSWTTIPITWRERKTGMPKLRVREMGSRYLFICLYVWLEKYFSRGDYKASPAVVRPSGESGERLEPLD